MDQTEQKKVAKSEGAQREEEILAFWNEQKIFDKTLTDTLPDGERKPEFVFYEGPPTANAAPALHHLEARAFKDVIPRYKTMRGFHVRRKGGWDTHGLPVELQIEKKLGLTSKKDIENYGIAEFNRACRESVWEYMEVWKQFTERIGYWVDDTHPYVTYHNSYIESVWNILAHVNSKKLLYKDYKVVPWCPRCGTALSSHELAQGYQDITDLSVYVKFKVTNPEHVGLSGDVFLLAWTTTPWTLPGNVGLAVGEEIEYLAIMKESETIIVSTQMWKNGFFGEFGNMAIGKNFKGSDLVGLSYEPLYPYLRDLAQSTQSEQLKNAFKVYPADFVTTTDGTGIVHTAVMYGQEDFELGTKFNLPKFHIVALDGTFIDGLGDFSGKHVRDEETAVDVIKNLAHRGLLFKKEKHKHSYPHCWRCKTALIYYARDSWYIGMSKLRTELQTENEKINWEPSHIKEGRFGEWLREAKDWAISRERYWGTPLPIWTTSTGDITVIGSVDELKKYSKKSGNRYFAMRHGEAEHNILDIWSTRRENAHHLTSVGEEQVRNTVGGIQGMLGQSQIDYVYVSPFLRTQETADIVSKALGISKEKIVFDDRLVEWVVGGFEAKPMRDYFEARKGSTDPYTFEVDGSESYRSIIKRSGDFIYELEHTHTHKNILIISHGAVVRALSFVAQGISIENEETLRNSFVNFSCAEVREIHFAPLPHNEFFELDVHRPYIDELELVNEKGESMTRTKEVMDVWFDSGSMPFAQDHYPFENREFVDGAGYPADFISEAIDQTRGWFYTLLCVGVLMDRGTPYTNVICLGHILDKEGKKMSKSIGNIVNPWEMMDRYGVDALRLWMYSVNQPGDSKNFDEKTVDEIVKKIFNPLSNIYTLCATYNTGVSRIDPHTSLHVLDQWILTRLNMLIREGTGYLEQFKVFEPVRLLRDFVQDFTTWYIRRSRERFKSKDAQEVSVVVSVTEHVLAEIAKYMAPMAPFYADWLYREVTKGSRMQSVHLEQWPQYSDGVSQQEIISQMETVRALVTEALELRQKAGIKVRQPLASLSVSHDLPVEFLDIIRDEINVKEVKVVSGNTHLDTTITPELRNEGSIRDIIRAIQDARKQENLEPSTPIELVVCAGNEIQKLIGEYTTAISEPTSVTRISYTEDNQKYEVGLEGEKVSVSIRY